MPVIFLHFSCSYTSKLYESWTRSNQLNILAVYQHEPFMIWEEQILECKKTERKKEDRGWKSVCKNNSLCRVTTTWHCCHRADNYNNVSCQYHSTVQLCYSYKTDSTWWLLTTGLQCTIYWPWQNTSPLRILIIFQELQSWHKFFTHLIIHKCGKFHYIICRIDKITLLLVTTT